MNRLPIFVLCLLIACVQCVPYGGHLVNTGHSDQYRQDDVCDLSPFQLEILL